MTSQRDGPISIVGNVNKCDNAGEFLSREFKAMLAGVGTHQTTCPPHVHQLNGVAERAIRSIMEQIRVNLVASNLPISFCGPTLRSTASTCSTAPPAPPTTTSRASR